MQHITRHHIQEHRIYSVMIGRFVILASC